MVAVFVGAMYGGPRDGKVIDLEGHVPYRVDFPRYRDDGVLVNDAYEFAGARFHYDGVPHPFRYVGEERPPAGDRKPQPPTWRERLRGFLSHLRG